MSLDKVPLMAEHIEELKTLLEKQGYSVPILANRLGKSATGVRAWLNGKNQISPVSALQIELVTGYPAERLLYLQAIHQLKIARRDFFAKRKDKPTTVLGQDFEHYYVCE